MGKGVEIPCIVGMKIPWLGGRYTMGSGKNTNDRGKHFLYRGVKISWVGGQNTMNGGSIYHGYGVRYTMIRVVKYYAQGSTNTKGKSSIYHG